jgi:hypothetical protein
VLRAGSPPATSTAPHDPQTSALAGLCFRHDAHATPTDTGSDGAGTSAGIVGRMIADSSAFDVTVAPSA